MSCRSIALQYMMHNHIGCYVVASREDRGSRQGRGEHVGTRRDSHGCTGVHRAMFTKRPRVAQATPLVFMPLVNITNVESSAKDPSLPKFEIEMSHRWGLVSERLGAGL